MYIIQIHTLDVGWKDIADGFESFDAAAEYSLTKIADTSPDNYGELWRIGRDEPADDCIPTGFGNDAEDFHSDG